MMKEPIETFNEVKITVADIPISDLNVYTKNFRMV